MEAVGAVFSRTEVICAVLSLVGAAVGYLTVRATAAQQDKKRKADIEEAAQEARAKVKVEAEKNAVDAWHSIAGEYKGQVKKLLRQNKSQQRQINGIKAKQENSEQLHEECEEKHKEALKRLEAVEGTVTKIASGSH